MILMENVAITTYLLNLIYFKIQGLSPLYFVVEEVGCVDFVVWSEGRLLEKCLILILRFSLRCVTAYIYPKLCDNVIRDEVLFVSYQFSFKILRRLPPNTARSVSQILEAQEN